MKNFTEHYKTKARNKQNTAADIVTLCAYKAIKSKSNASKIEIFSALIDRAFTPITNPNKLANGRKPYDTLMSLLAGNRLYYGDGRSSQTLVTTIKEHVIESDEELTQFKDLFKELLGLLRQNDALLKKHYSYIFIDSSLSASQRIVQASHASIELGHDLAKNNQSVSELNLVACPLLSHEELLEQLSNKGIKNIVFREPDLDNQITAIATWPIEHNQKGWLRKFALI